MQGPVSLAVQRGELALLLVGACVQMHATRCHRRRRLLQPRPVKAGRATGRCEGVPHAAACLPHRGADTKLAKASTCVREGPRLRSSASCADHVREGPQPVWRYSIPVAPARGERWLAEAIQEPIHRSEAEWNWDAAHMSDMNNLFTPIYRYTGRLRQGPASTRDSCNR